jgi:hypothetical protein
MITIVITTTADELDSQDEQSIEFALDDIMTDVGFSDYTLIFE